jgi:hypothetical protein
MDNSGVRYAEHPFDTGKGGSVDKASEFIGTLEAKRRYGIAPQTIRKKVAAGQLRRYVDPWDSRKRLLNVSELEALLHGTPQPTPPKRDTRRDSEAA